LAQHVLHRLPKAEIDTERQRGDELRQPDMRTISPHGHSEPRDYPTRHASNVDEAGCGASSR
jgi:hypothetical protein